MKTPKLATLLIGLLLCSCGIISDSQLASINNLSSKADSLSNSSQSLLYELAEIRKDRSIYYIASIQNAEYRIKELNSTTDQYIKDFKFAEKASLTSDILSSYLRALKSISSPIRWSQIGVELRGIGRSIDSSIIKYNALEWSADIEDGYAKTYSKLVAHLSENYMKGRQKKLVIDLIKASDSLVSKTCLTTINMLKSGELDTLINNEIIGIEIDFKSYLEQSAKNKTPISLDNYNKYIELKLRLNRIEHHRKRSISALNSIKRAHNKLCTNIEKNRGLNFDNIWEDILTLNKLLSKLEP